VVVFLKAVARVHYFYEMGIDHGELPCLPSDSLRRPCVKIQLSYDTLFRAGFCSFYWSSAPRRPPVRVFLPLGLFWTATPRGTGNLRINTLDGNNLNPSDYGLSAHTIEVTTVEGNH
jgi:hypothetical protein